MHFSSSDISPSLAYQLLVSTVVPRPIAFVTTLDEQGRSNAAPFSFFNAMGSEPPVIVLGFEPKTDGSRKDTPNNIIATGEFVVNLVDEALSTQMNQCAAALDSQISEIEHAGLSTLPSLSVAPPRLRASPVQFECRLFQTTPLAGGGCVVIGEVLEFHVRDELVTSVEPLRIDLNKLGVISRLSGPQYGRITDSFQLVRPGSSGQ